MKKTYDSFRNAVRGIRLVWKEEKNFKIEILATAIICFSILYFHFTLIESALCVIAVTLVLAAEMVNTAIEDLCNKVEPNTDAAIGRIKDVMSGFVLTVAFGALILGILVFYNHFCPGYLLQIM